MHMLCCSLSDECSVQLNYKPVFPAMTFNTEGNDLKFYSLRSSVQMDLWTCHVSHLNAVDLSTCLICSSTCFGARESWSVPRCLRLYLHEPRFKTCDNVKSSSFYHNLKRRKRQAKLAWFCSSILNLSTEWNRLCKARTTKLACVTFWVVNWTVLMNSFHIIILMHFIYFFIFCCVHAYFYKRKCLFLFSVLAT